MPTTLPSLPRRAVTLHPVVLHALWIGTALRILIPSAADPDLWGHVLFGGLLLGGTLPATNGFSYTAPAHPWVNHELLAEIWMAATYGAGGAPGLVAMKVLIGLGTLLIVWRSAARRSGSAAAAAVATALAAVVMTPGFMIRPQLFTLLFFAATLGVLARARFAPRDTAWCLPGLMVLWVNTHGGVMAGVGVTALGLAGGLAARARAGQAGGREAGATLALVAATGAALLVNPYGVELVRFFVHDVTPRVPITEWAPVPLLDGSFPLFKVLLLATLCGLLRGHRHAVGLPEALIVTVTAILALRHQRHVPLFAIAAAPLVARLLADGWEVAARRLGGGTLRGLRAGTAAVVAAQLVLALGAGLGTGGRIYVDPWAYPVQALRFLAQNDITGNVALPFRWGEYALWALPPGSRVAVDGRFTTAYPHRVLDDVWRFMAGGPGWRTLLAEHPTDIVVADRRQAPARLLRGDREWAYVYSDPISVVFVRRVPSQAATLARFEAGGLTYDDAPLPADFPAVARPPRHELGACQLARRAAPARRATWCSA